MNAARPPARAAALAADFGRDEGEQLLIDALGQRGAHAVRSLGDHVQFALAQQLHRFTPRVIDRHDLIVAVQGIAQVEFLEQRGDIRGVSIRLVAVPGLLRTSVPAAIMATTRCR